MMEAWTLIEPERLAGMLEQDNPLVLDCRFDLEDPDLGRRLYRSEHVPGARYAHLDEDLSDMTADPSLGRHPLPPAGKIARRLGEWCWDGQQPVIVYDDGSGAMAARAWWLMRMIGHDRTAVLNGGWRAWKALGLPVDDTRPPACGDSVEVTIDHSRLLTTEAVKSMLAEGSGLLLDARAENRFAGRFEPIDTRAGHVPGARNRPFADNLDDSGRFKPAARLLEEFRSILDGWNSPDVVHMCGSGVTACHNLLAMEHAGMPGSRLYAPSFSGWISNPQQPVEVA